MYAHYKCHQWPYVTNKWSRSWSSETVKQYFYRKMLILKKVNTINRKEVTGHWRWRDSRSLVWDEEKTRPGHMLGWMLQAPFSILTCQLCNWNGIWSTKVCHLSPKILLKTVKHVITWRDDMPPTDPGGSKSLHKQMCSPHSYSGLA